jgi:hypothetical protein
VDSQLQLGQASESCQGVSLQAGGGQRREEYWCL